MTAFETFKLKKWYGYLENVIFSTFYGVMRSLSELSHQEIHFLGSVMVDFLMQFFFCGTLPKQCKQKICQMFLSRNYGQLNKMINRGTERICFFYSTILLT